MTLSDVSYDLISVLQSKLDAIAVYEQYIEDCKDAGATECEQLFEQIKQQDELEAERLRDELERMVKEGKFH